MKGERYEATVPDTLDLVERAEYAINAMTGALDPEHDYEYMWQVWFAPLKLVRHAATWWDSSPRAGWTLPLMRIMSGSEHNLDIEDKMVESMLSRVGADVQEHPYPLLLWGCHQRVPGLDKRSLCPPRAA